MIKLGGCIVRGEYYIILYAHTCLRLKNVLRLLRCDASQLHCLLRCDASLLVSLTARLARSFAASLLCFNITHCIYATPLIFFNVYCIFFGFRAFYPQIIQKFALPLHRNSKSSHAHRTLIARSSRYHRTHVQVQPRSGVPVAPRRIQVACGVKKIRTRFSRLNKIFYSTTRNNFGNFEKFCSI